jgi:hypothetical protein
MTTNRMTRVLILVLLSACGATKESTVSTSSASDSGSVTGKESASEIALSSVSGSLADSEGVSAELALMQRSSRLGAFARALGLLPSPALAAPKACPVLSNATLADCASGKLVLPLDSCQYERLNKSFAKAVWTGSKILDFGNGCPKRLIDITKITRTMGDGTTRTGGDGVVLTIDTAAPSGYDSQVSPQPVGGTVVTRSMGARTVDITGVHYVAAKGGNKLWDHTLSTSDPLAITIQKDGTQSVSGTVVLQHNLAKYTAKAELSGVVFDFAKCGCLPVSGTITATLSGSRMGTETLDITGCAAASYASEKGAKSAITLRHCL